MSLGSKTCRLHIYVVFLLTLLLGCRKKAAPVPVAHPWEEQRRATINYIQSMISSTPAPKEDLERYRDGKWRETEAFLKKASEERSEEFPHLVLAVWRTTDEHSDGLSLLWLEPGFDVTGISLTDVNGPLGTFACIKPYAIDERKAYSTTMVRTVSIDIDTANTASTVPSTAPSRVTLSRAVDGPTLRVQLLRGNAGASEPTAPFLYGRKLLPP
jgi:hypothetical protein